MPYHESIVVIHALLLWEVVDVVVELIGIRIQQNSYCILDTFVRTICVVRRTWIFLDGCNNFRVLRHLLSPSFSGVEQRTVLASYVGDIPNSIGTRTVLQRTTGQSVCITLHYLLVEVCCVRVEWSTICMNTACYILCATVFCTICALFGCVTTECGIECT